MRIQQPSLAALTLLLVSLASVNADSSSIHDGVPTAQLLSQADGLLSRGKGADALELYGVAVERDSASYVSRVGADTRSTWNTRREARLPLSDGHY